MKVWVVICYSHDKETDVNPEIYGIYRTRELAEITVLEALENDYEEHDSKYKREIIELDERFEHLFQDDGNPMEPEFDFDNIDLSWHKLVNVFKSELVNDECKGIYTSYKIVKSSAPQKY